MMARKVKERNEKYLASLAANREQKQKEAELEQKKMDDQRKQLRDQISSINQLAKKKSERVEEVKEVEKQEVAKIEGPSKEFMDRMNKSRKVKGPPIVDWNQYLKRHNLTDTDRIFICSNAYRPLIEELERRGWHRNKDRKSSIFHLKYVILESESSMLEDLKPFQMVNHFLGNNLIVTKVGL
jgi:hypothetical protein